MELVEKIREQNRIRAKRYYDKHHSLISERRKALRRGDEPPQKESIIEEPYSKTQLNKLNNEIEIIQQELKRLKANPKSQIKQAETKTTEPKKYTYTLEESIQIIKDNIEAKESQKSYINSVKQLYEIIAPKDNNLFKALKRYQYVIGDIQKASKKNDETSSYSINSIKQLFQAIVKLITLYNMPLSEKAIKAYEDIFNIYKIKSNDQTKERKENTTLLFYDDYLKLVEQKFGKNSKQYLIVSIYKINTFRDDLGHLLIVPSKPKQVNEELNYIVVPSNRTQNASILLNTYKTQKKYGKEKIDINKEYSKLIRDYIDINKLSYDDYLFGNAKSLSSYVSKFNKELGLDITINTIRKMKISSALNSEEALNNPNIRLQVAKEAHHNPSTSISAYKFKISKNKT